MMSRSNPSLPESAGAASTGRARPTAPTAHEAAQLLALAAHELRNPLLPLRLQIRLARAGRSADAGLCHSLDLMDRQVDYMQRLVDDLLEWARPAGCIRLVARKPADLAEIIHAATEALRPLAAARQVSFEVDVEGPVHPITGDADRLLQMCMNLIGNALKFTGPGGTIGVELWRVHGGEMLQVSDSGIGIPAPELGRIFEPFVTGLGTTGLGLGLAIVRQVAQAHGGWARAESAGPGQGARFIVWLPASGA